MIVSIFADSKFITDGKGNFHTSSNMRKAMLYPIAKRFDKLIIVCRLRQTDLGHIAHEDLINHPKIEFVGLPYFRGIIGSTLSKRKLLRHITPAVEKADVCVLRFPSNIACLASPFVQSMRRPSIGHVLGEIDMEIRENPSLIPVPLLRHLIASWILHVNQRAFQACDILCGVTANAAQSYAQPGRPLHQLVDSCLSPESYSPPPQRKGKKVRAIFAGRLIEFKNVQSFLRAAAQLKKESIDIHTILIGEGVFKPQLVELTRNLGLDQHVEFIGRVESRQLLWQKYRSADIGFMLSLSEGLPLGAIEPMSVGLPLIASDLDFMKPIITDGIEGFLVNPKNINEIADRLKILTTDVQTRYKMGMAAFERSQMFSAESQADKLLALAAELTKSKSVKAVDPERITGQSP